MHIHILTLRITAGSKSVSDALVEFVYWDNSTERVVQSGRTDADGYVKLRIGEDAPPHAYLRLTRPGENPKLVGEDPIWLCGVASGPPAKTFNPPGVQVLLEYSPPAAPAPTAPPSMLTGINAGSGGHGPSVTQPASTPTPPSGTHRIQVTVRDAANKPVAGARIYLVPPGSPEPVTSARTDAQGGATLSVEPAKAPLTASFFMETAAGSVLRPDTTWKRGVPLQVAGVVAGSAGPGRVTLSFHYTPPATEPLHTVQPVASTTVVMTSASPQPVTSTSTASPPPHVIMPATPMATILVAPPAVAPHDLGFRLTAKALVGDAPWAARGIIATLFWGAGSTTQDVPNSQRRLDAAGRATFTMPYTRAAAALARQDGVVAVSLQSKPTSGAAVDIATVILRSRNGGFEMTTVKGRWRWGPVQNVDWSPVPGRLAKASGTTISLDVVLPLGLDENALMNLGFLPVRAPNEVAGTITGSVLSKDGQAPRSVRIEVWEVSAKGRREQVGGAVPDSRGAYIAPWSWDRPEGGDRRPDLQLVVVDSLGESVVTSSVISDAAASEEVNLRLPEDFLDLPEFDLVHNLLTAFIARYADDDADPDVAGWASATIDYASSKADLPPARVAQYAIAHRLAHEVGMARDLDYVAAFYAFVRMGATPEARGISGRGVETNRKALTEALSQRILNEILQDGLEEDLFDLEEVIAHLDTWWLEKLPSWLKAEPFWPRSSTEAWAWLAWKLSSVEAAVPAMVRALREPDWSTGRGIAVAAVPQGMRKFYGDALDAARTFAGVVDHNFGLLAVLPTLMRAAAPRFHLPKVVLAASHSDWTEVVTKAYGADLNLAATPDLAAQIGLLLYHRAEALDPMQRFLLRAETRQGAPEWVAAAKAIRRHLDKAGKKDLRELGGMPFNTFKSSLADPSGSVPPTLKSMVRLYGLVMAAKPRYAKLEESTGAKWLADREEAAYRLATARRDDRRPPQSPAGGNNRVDGYPSAWEIALRPAASFIKDLAPLLGEEWAKAIHNEALSVAGTLHTAQVELSAPTIEPRCVVGRPGDFKDLGEPDSRRDAFDALLEKIYNGVKPTEGDPPSSVKVEWADSVHGPAAYLVWLLDKLTEETEPGGYRTVAGLLDERRPDIRHTLLTKQNTDVPVQYVDLVNNLLAYRLLPALPDGSAHQDELVRLFGFEPERSAYSLRVLGDDLIAELPEDFGGPGRLDETRAEALRELLRSSTASPRPRVWPWVFPLVPEREVLLDYVRALGLSPGELAETSTGASPPTSRGAAWGSAWLGVSVQAWNALLEDDTESQWGGSLRRLPNRSFVLDGGPLIREILRRSDLSGEELALVCRTRFVASAGEPWVLFYQVEGDLGTGVFVHRSAQFVNGAPNTLDVADVQTIIGRIYHFERLRRLLGTSIGDTDALLVTLQRLSAGDVTRDLSPEDLSTLAAAAKLAQRLRVGIPEVLAAWAPIDPDGFGPNSYVSLLHGGRVDPNSPFRLEGAPLSRPFEPRVCGVLARLWRVGIAEVEDHADWLFGPNPMSLADQIQQAIDLGRISTLVRRPLAELRTISNLAKHAGFLSTGPSGQEWLKGPGRVLELLDFARPWETLDVPLEHASVWLEKGFKAPDGDAKTPPGGIDNMWQFLTHTERTALLAGWLGLSEAERILIDPMLTGTLIPGDTPLIEGPLPTSEQLLSARLVREMLRETSLCNALDHALRTGAPRDALQRAGQVLVTRWLWTWAQTGATQKGDGLQVLVRRLACWRQCEADPSGLADAANNEATVETIERFTVLERAALTCGTDLNSVAAWADALGSEGNVPARCVPEARETLLVLARAGAREAAIAIEDTARNRKNAALVALVREREALSDSDDLAQALLCDPEVLAGRETSRVKFAIGAVQTFINQIGLGLVRWPPHPEAILPSGGGVVTLSLFDNKTWEWARSYRMWEANRKVFLYPENWIEPDLRDDKSEIYRQFEEDFVQKEVTSASAERAFAGYLAGLAEVSNLEYSAMQSETAGSASPMHFVARTRGTDAKWYHRTRRADRTWTPWEQLRFGIDSETVAVTSYLGAPCILWLRVESTSTPVRPQRSSDNADPIEPANVERPIGSVRYARRIESGRWVTKEIPNKIVFRSRLTPSSYNMRAVPAGHGRLAVQIEKDCGLDISSYLDNTSTDEEPSAEPLSFEIVKFTLSSGDAYAPDSASTVELFALPAATNLELRAVNGVLYSSKKDVGGIRSNVSSRIDRDGWVVRFRKNREPGPGHLQLLYSDAHGDGRVETTNPQFPADTGEHTIALYTKSQVPVTYRDSCDHTDIISLKVHVFSIVPCSRQWPFTGSDPFVYTVETASVVDRHPDTDSEWAMRFPRPMMVEARKTEFGVFNYAMTPLYHPFAEVLRTAQLLGSVEAILGRSAHVLDGVDVLHQVARRDWDVLGLWNPTKVEVADDRFEFDETAPYGLYNWEIFFHAPFHIARTLAAAQRYVEAERWYRYIFDPRGTLNLLSAESETLPKRYWHARPFLEAYEAGDVKPIDRWVRHLANQGRNSEVDASERDPFSPYVIARQRPMTLMKAVVYGYFDNLIAWADDLFQRDTLETIEEATQLYLVAWELLGARPQLLERKFRPPESYDTLVKHGGNRDGLGNAIAEVEALVWTTPRTLRSAPPPDIAATTYFGVPSNEKLLGYWSTLADRLYKLRNNQDIEGRHRVLELFEPPIDPGLLVKARAAGIDVDAIVSQASAIPKGYRFTWLLAKALELCGDLRGIATSLLASLEKRDAEDMTLLRSRHERTLLRIAGQVRESQVEEARRAVATAGLAAESARARRDYLARLVAKGRIPEEAAELASTQLAKTFEDQAAAWSLASSVANAAASIPSFTDPNAPAKAAGLVLSETAALYRSLAGVAHGDARISSINAGWKRRTQEWQHQLATARRDAQQAEHQELAAAVRLAIAEHERESHMVQLAQSAEVDDFLRAKFSSRQLYNRNVATLGAAFRKAWEMVYNMAGAAKDALEHELGLEPGKSGESIPRWAGDLADGLQAPETLLVALRALEGKWIELNHRRSEMVVHVSVVQHFKTETLFNSDHRCEFTIRPSEIPALHILDAARIRTVAVSVPCVAGPYTPIRGSLKLTLPDGSVDTIELSHGREDYGVFEPNLQGERLMPFEGHKLEGSTWTLELVDGEVRKSVSDIILHIRYTAPKPAST